ncbi:M23 family metallopeptidase [Actinocatenispora comari]|uniref:M23ase beta-sheet core domain-containing protein n=1 Tax=Actinocatenispora comari TaxID=2807577 RepID=A0A8J4ELB6_9ACTN|nr:M23 family metallopeptidase [Actinocatenispora comari]GIL29107.1 hypothetical protein NUM_43610 [Actinocatenispora comari]
MLRTVAALLGGSVLTMFLGFGALGAMLGDDASNTSCTAVSAPGRIGHYDASQTANAATIIRVGQQLHVPQRGWVIAVATAIQESSLHNLVGGDRDSVGLFQQRPSQGWGTPNQLHTPSYAAAAFYHALQRVAGWQHMPLTAAAQAVQKSAFPHAYAQWETDATHLVDTIILQPSTVDAADAAALQTRPSTHHTNNGASPAGTIPAGCSAATWISPVIAPISSGFRPPDRPDHNGADLAAARGTTIRAAHAGTVTVAHCDPATGNCNVNGSITTPGCGWYVEIRSPDHIITRYCHMAVRPTVHVGQKVTTGAALGVVGQSGNADGPHLHFEIHLRDDPNPSGAVDPVAFYRSKHLVLGHKQTANR